jgi:hypothetical protein
MRPAVVLPGDQEPVPVHGCVNVESIINRYLYLITAAYAKDWPQDRR